MRYVKVMAVVLVFVVCGCMTGCFSAKRKAIEAFVKPFQRDVTCADYVLYPPDEVEIHCARVPEINLQRQQIRPDGRISFESLGEIEVAGKTTAQVADILREKAAKLYSLTGDKPIDVRVVAYASKVYYVVGEVSLPGTKPYTGRDTLLTAVAAANVEITGWEEHIQVIRPSADKEVKPQVFEVNLLRMIVHGDTSKNVLLQEGDIVYIPPTPLAAAGNLIAEFVRPIGLALSPVLTATRISSSGGGY